jgi:hypothetical protein
MFLITGTASMVKVTVFRLILVHDHHDHHDDEQEHPNRFHDEPPSVARDSPRARPMPLDVTRILARRRAMDPR